MSGGSTHPGGEGPRPSRLTELLECEHELGDLLVAAREEARQRVADARDEAGRAEADLEATLEEATERVRHEIRDQAQAAVHEVLARAREEAARFESISEAGVARLAESAYRRLLREGGAP